MNDGLAPGDEVVQGRKDLLPDGFEYSGNLLPRQFFGPESQILHVGGRQFFLALGPGHLSNLDPAPSARDATKGVQEKTR